MTSHEEQKRMQRESMERQRFGYTKREIIAQKGITCYICGKPTTDGDRVIDHIKGGGRHATETGMIIEGKTHNMDNLGIAHRSCAGKKDRIRSSMGLGIGGNPNNPS